MFRRRKQFEEVFEQIMDEELRTHIRQYVDDLIARGVPASEAERRARVEFGAIQSIKEECREARGSRWISGLQRDFRYAFRLLKKSPGFTATAILTLALCIGANTAIFSVVDAVLLRPLPYPEPDRLAQLVTTFRRAGMQNDTLGHSGIVWELLRDQARAIELAAFSDSGRGVNLSSGGVVQHVRQQRIGAAFFRVLGVQPLIGREFDASEDIPGGPALAILAHDLWRNSFAADPSIVGRPILLKGEPHTVIGVMPQGFQTSSNADLWTPLRPSRTGEGGGSNYGIIARLKPGVTWTQAAAEMQTISTALVALLKRGPEVTSETRLVSLQEGLTQSVRTPLLALWGAVGLVLLIGCVNIASLLLSRSAERRQEVATRIAVGGGAAVILRQLLTEAMLLAMAGGVLGVLLGYAGLRILRVTLAPSLGLWQTITLDERVLATTCALSLITSVLFGILPALQATKVDVRTTLIEGNARSVAGRKNHWPHRLLVAGEVALGMVLLVGSALLLRSFSYLSGLRPGFDPTNVMTARVSLDDARYDTTEAVARVMEESVARIKNIGGVEHAAVALTLPFERALNMPFTRMDGPEASSQMENTNVAYVSGEYFDALRIPILRGRTFDGRDKIDSQKVVIVNEAFVKRYLSRQDPMGSHLKNGNATSEIVGVVGDVQQKAGWGSFQPLAPIPQVFLPVRQIEGRALRLFHTWFSPAWIVRTRGTQSGLTAGMQQAIQAVDPQLPFAGFTSMQTVRTRSIAAQRLQAFLVAALGLLALVLAALGVYGLVAQTVIERTRELGIRMALGATVSQGIRAVALPSLMLSVAGVVAGVGLSLWASQLLKKMVWGVSATDPFTLTSVGVGLVAVAAVACAVPAIRLIRLNPADTLRHE